ncbi:hypothetical protein TTRE_0000062201 [Trichuris trichiura]|uniref:Uncharacterized protein n=1 Tax=Trichuris trichiura TaxID=36087 RepID=A0A077YY31_TRITR|nr:hypothetical protein TTRE_0000062201 [Trichuris trichiura]
MALDRVSGQRQSLLIDSLSDSEPEVPDLELIPPGASKKSRPNRWKREAAAAGRRKPERPVDYHLVLSSPHFRISLLVLATALLAVLGALIFYVASLHGQLSAVKNELKELLEAHRLESTESSHVVRGPLLLEPPSDKSATFQERNMHLQSLVRKLHIMNETIQRLVSHSHWMQNASETQWTNSNYPLIPKEMVGV